MKKLPKFSVFAVALMLGACSHYNEDLASLDGVMKAQPAAAPMMMADATASPQDIAPAAGTTSMGGSLNSVLAREYYDLARFENDKAYDYKAAKQYTEKALMASKGQVPMPSKISAFDVPEEKILELTEARTSLISALKEQNTPDNSQTLAKARSNFDCWLERAEEAADDAHYAECKANYEQAMASLVMPAAGIETPVSAQTSSAFDIMFAQNSNVPESTANALIDQVAQFLKAPQNAAYTASLTGFTAATAQGEFANNLVNARVFAVRDALIAKGVNASQLKPLVSAQPTSENRKVQVVLIAPTAVQ